jgi:hypothetical protein
MQDDMAPRKSTHAAADASHSGTKGHMTWHKSSRLLQVKQYSLIFK